MKTDAQGRRSRFAPPNPKDRPKAAGDLLTSLDETDVGCGTFHTDEGMAWTPCGNCGRRRSLTEEPHTGD